MRALYCPKGYVGFVISQKVFMIRCPQCRMENHAPSVATGVCAHCQCDGTKSFENGEIEIQKCGPEVKQ